MAWTTPRDWTDGELVTEALLDTHLRDNLLALTTWTSYSPTWAATGGTPTIGNGTLTGRHITAGGLCIVQLMLTIGSTTSMGATTAWTLSTPVAPTSMAVGSWAYKDASAGWHGSGACFTAGAGSSSILFQLSSGDFIGSALPVSPSTGDYIAATLTYDC